MTNLAAALLADLAGAAWIMVLVIAAILAAVWLGLEATK